MSDPKDSTDELAGSEQPFVQHLMELRNRLLYGVIGLAIAYLTRSSAIAISVGAGYVLVVESMISQVFDTTPDWLLSGTLTAVAQGGSATVSQGTALAWAGLYVALGLAAASVVLLRRDVTD